MKHLVFTNMPSLYDFGIIKTCIHRFNLTKKDQGQNRPSDAQDRVANQDKKILNIYELYLYMSFPLCPREVLTQIALHYFG